MKNTKLKFLLMLLIGICFTFTSSISANPPIKGTITYHEELPMSDITIYLYDNNYTFVDSAITNSNGKYIFEDMPYGEYILHVNIDMAPTGVDMDDAYLVEQHLLGNDTLTAFEYYAADVDGDGIVTWDDYYAITDWWLTFGIPFPVGEWKCEDLSISFYCTDEGQDNDAKVTETGDVDGEGYPDKLTPFNIQTLIFEEIIVTNNEIFEIPVFIENDINLNSFHFSLEYNNSVLELIDVKTLNPEGVFNADNGIIKITCRNNNEYVESHSKIAILFVKLKASVDKTETISFSLSEPPQFLDENGEQLKTLQLSIPKIKIKSESFDIHGSYPNPFNSIANIEYYIPAGGYVTVEIYNTGGQLVNLPVKEFREAGDNKYQFDGAFLPEGIYICKVYYSAPGQKEIIKSKPMIKSN